MAKIGRNDPCPCGSGQEYKYCCKGVEHKDRKPNAPSELINPNGMEFFKLIMNALSSENEPLRCFCKDNFFYLFQNITISEMDDLKSKLSNDTLTKGDFFVCYKKNTTNEYVARMLKVAMKQSDFFKKRQIILNSAVKAHFDCIYALSIPAFFIIIEGILRDVGNLELKQTFKPTMTNGWLEEKVAYTKADSIGYFNAFVTNLFSGSQDAEKFNRNTILHGANNSCFNEENSLILLLSILEIQNYIFHDKSWPPKLKMENGIATFYHPNT